MVPVNSPSALLWCIKTIVVQPHYDKKVHHKAIYATSKKLAQNSLYL